MAVGACGLARQGDRPEQLAIWREHRRGGTGPLMVAHVPVLGARELQGALFDQREADGVGARNLLGARTAGHVVVVARHGEDVGVTEDVQHHAVALGEHQDEAGALHGDLEEVHEPLRRFDQAAVFLAHVRQLAGVQHHGQLGRPRVDSHAAAAPPRLHHLWPDDGFIHISCIDEMLPGCIDGGQGGLQTHFSSPATNDRREDHAGPDEISRPGPGADPGARPVTIYSIDLSGYPCTGCISFI